MNEILSDRVSDYLECLVYLKMSKISLKCVIKFGVNSQANNTHAKGVTKHAQRTSQG